MSYRRVVSRNQLLGDYDDGYTPLHKSIAGDLRRMEINQRDTQHLSYAAWPRKE